MMLAKTLLHEHARERQAWERERAKLIATICHLAGRFDTPIEPPRASVYETDADTEVVFVDPAQLPE